VNQWLAVCGVDNGRSVAKPSQIRISTHFTRCVRSQTRILR